MLAGSKASRSEVVLQIERSLQFGYLAFSVFHLTIVKTKDERGESEIWVFWVWLLRVGRYLRGALKFFHTQDRSKACCGSSCLTMREKKKKRMKRNLILHVSSTLEVYNDGDGRHLLRRQICIGVFLSIHSPLVTS